MFSFLKQKKVASQSTTSTTGAFTIVESLVAMSILLLAVTGAYNTAQKSLQDSEVAREQVTGYYLAQEAIEYARNIRDANFLSGGDWLDGLTGLTCGVGNDCLIDPEAALIKECSISPNGCLLQQNLVSGSPFYGMYSHYDSSDSHYNGWDGGDWTTSIYTRKVRFEISPDNNELSVMVTVSWFDHVQEKIESIVLRELLFDWH